MGSRCSFVGRSRQPSHQLFRGDEDEDVLSCSSRVVAISGAVFAKDLKGRVMTDAEMDEVTAGTIHPGQGLGTAFSTGNSGWVNGYDNGLHAHAFANAQTLGPAGNGLCTAKLICP